MKKLTYVLSLCALVVLAASCQKETVAQLNSAAKSSDEALRVVNNGDTPATMGPQSNAMSAPKKGDQSIAAIAIDNDFDELVAALSYVDEEEGTALVDLFLNGTDQYTVFAPTDAAFEDLYDALGADEITDLPSDLVLNVLLYHVTEGRRASNSVVPKKNAKTIETLLGESFDVNSDLSIDAIGNTANIVAADISASNGIIHVIDAVILPIE